MSPSQIDSVYIKHAMGRVRQGDIYRDIPVLFWESSDDTPDFAITSITLSYAVVMTQDCDLESDYRNRSELNPAKHDKYLQSILLCPAYPAEYFKSGTHLEDLRLQMEKWNSTAYGSIKRQSHSRFHYLENDQENQVQELIIDFKHYYTVPRDILYLYNDKYLISLNALFREHLSQRFSNYLCRIGLPDLQPKT